MYIYIYIYIYINIDNIDKIIDNEVLRNLNLIYIQLPLSLFLESSCDYLILTLTVS